MKRPTEKQGLTEYSPIIKKIKPGCWTIGSCSCCYWIIKSGKGKEKLNILLP